MADLPWFALLAVAALAVVMVVAAGTVLAKVGDDLAERTGIGRLYVGALLVAVATSLPELATDITAAASDAPDLAIGDLFGSSMANMAILAIVDLRHRGRVLPRVELGHTRVAAVAIGLTALAVMDISTAPGIDIFHVGIAPIGIMCGYLAALAWFRRVPPIGVAKADPTPFRRPPSGDRWLGTKPMLIRFAAAATVLLVAAPALTFSAEEIAVRTGVSQSFLGVTLLAVSTSLPELAASLAAVRLGAFDLALGNLLGSNAVNMAMIVFIDAAYRPGPILAAVDSTSVVAGTGAILLMSLALASIVSGKANRAQRLEPDSFVLLVAYVGAVAAVALAV
ncbi:MAG TPA: hypothetical protein VMW08_05445 [Acidimicrobiales bacterium]|nr:hypothetical protein [Acidimicrobiales bacterium]